MVEDLLRGFVAGPQADDIDFSTLEKLSAEYVSDELLKRHGDAAWRVRLRERWLHLVVLLEFQSRDEPRMALRRTWCRVSRRNGTSWLTSGIWRRTISRAAI